MIAEAGLQWIWSADFHKLEAHYMRGSLQFAGLFLPISDIVTSLVAIGLCVAVWAAMRYTWLGKALRASLDNPNIAAALWLHDCRGHAAGIKAAKRDRCGLFRREAQIYFGQTTAISVGTKNDSTISPTPAPAMKRPREMLDDSSPRTKETAAAPA
jgi:hypothetical protein